MEPLEEATITGGYLYLYCFTPPAYPDPPHSCGFTTPIFDSSGPGMLCERFTQSRYAARMLTNSPLLLTVWKAFSGSDSSGLKNMLTVRRPWSAAFYCIIST